jgi:hypothetical protein
MYIITYEAGRMNTTSLGTKSVFFVIIAICLIIMISSAFSGPAIAVKKNQGIKSIHETTNTGTSFTSSSNGQYHIKGVKLLELHTKPSSVAVGNTFSIRAVVFNNSSSPITFFNGTCSSPVSATFNRNVLTENQGIAMCATPQAQVTLKPGGHSAILSPNLSGIVYKATGSGMTNAKIDFDYGVETNTGISPVSDTISRTYTFNIDKATSSGVTTTHHHIKGVKLLQLHTDPSSVAVGNTFSIRAVVFNNSSSPITFSNGTCSSPVSATFNRNVLTENQRTTSFTVTPQKATLKPSERSAVFSAIPYKATAPGRTNATIIFNYGVETADGKFTINDNTSRVHTFNILNFASAGSTHTSTHYHIKGVKLLHVHTIPSKIAVGNTFSLQGIVYNNSSATITFANGTCTTRSLPLSITFNRNVMTGTKAAATSCKPQQVTLKPGDQSRIQSPNLSSIAYKATAPGMTNATMIFKYAVETPTSKSPIIDTISRTYAFDIQPSNHQPVIASTSASTVTTATTNRNLLH